MTDELVIATWGIGPSFRTRVKENIKLHAGKPVKYVILTDLVDDFQDVMDSPSILSIIDIFWLIKEKQIDIGAEFIPSSRLEPEYAIEFRTRVGSFSYNARRFLFLMLAQRSITKFIMIDPDVYLKMSDDYLTQIDIPANTVSGIHREVIHAQLAEQNIMHVSNALGSQESVKLFQCMPHILQLMDPQGFPSGFERIHITEGPLRYYHFSTVDQLKKYFDVWNQSVYLLTHSRWMASLICGPGYMTSDYTPFAISNILCGMNVTDFPRHLATVNVFYEDRYFWPRSSLGSNNDFVMTNTIDEFYEKNTDEINYLKSVSGWPHKD